MEITRDAVLVVAAVAAFAPILADLTPRMKVPIVVAELVLGIVVGPDVLGLAETDAFVEALRRSSSPSP
jgi:Kef-type K+ transport system membrane component KefB